MFRCVFTVRFLAALVFSCAGGIGLCLDAAPRATVPQTTPQPSLPAFERCRAVAGSDAAGLSRCAQVGVRVGYEGSGARSASVPKAVCALNATSAIAQPESVQLQRLYAAAPATLSSTCPSCRTARGPPANATAVFNDVA